MSARSVIRSRYVLPQPCGSEDEDRRFAHLDLAGLSSLELWAEAHEARRALAALVHGTGETIRASWWLLERLQRARNGPT